MIPLVRTHGTHAEAGAAIGAATAEAIRRRLGEESLELAAGYREVTLRHLPWVVEELDAAAEAAGADPLLVFAASVEELSAAARGCTDVVLGRLVAHNNDLDAADEEDVVAIEWRVEGEPAIFTLGIGPWISVGWNEAGLSVTGNEVAPNDERVGIPRLLQVRDVLTRTTLDEAVEAVLHPARASAYNWVLASPEGAVNVEASATAAEIRSLDGAGALVHTNHYVEPAMRPFERDGDRGGSAARYRRARQLADAGAPPLEILRDHASAPEAICRHGEGTKTVFWCVADVAARRIEYGRGNPCGSEPQTYEFA